MAAGYVQCCTIRILAVKCDIGYLSLMHYFSVISENITISLILPKK